MKNSVFILFFIVSLTLFAQENPIVQPNQVYTTYYGLKNEKQYPLNTDFTVKVENDNVLVIDNFYNIITKESTPLMDVWNLFALRYNNEYYYNLDEIKDKPKERVFIKFDVIGNYCVFKIDPSTFKFDSITQYNNKNNQTATIFGAATFGLAGALFVYMIQDFAHSTESFCINNQNEKTNLYYINTKKQAKVIRMTYKRFTKLFPLHLSRVYRRITRDIPITKTDSASSAERRTVKTIVIAEKWRNEILSAISLFQSHFSKKLDSCLRRKDETSTLSFRLERSETEQSCNFSTLNDYQKTDFASSAE